MLRVTLALGTLRASNFAGHELHSERARRESLFESRERRRALNRSRSTQLSGLSANWKHPGPWDVKLTFSDMIIERGGRADLTRLGLMGHPPRHGPLALGLERAISQRR
jgi:hypothetical protein